MVTTETQLHILVRPVLQAVQLASALLSPNAPLVQTCQEQSTISNGVQLNAALLAQLVHSYQVQCLFTASYVTSCV